MRAEAFLLTGRSDILTMTMVNFCSIADHGRFPAHHVSLPLVTRWPLIIRELLRQRQSTGNLPSAGLTATMGSIHFFLEMPEELTDHTQKERTFGSKWRIGRVWKLKSWKVLISITVSAFIGMLSRHCTRHVNILV